MPARIVQVTDLPRTKSGKLVELAVRDVVHGREVRNREALANPEALELFKQLPQLALLTVTSWIRRSRVHEPSDAQNQETTIPDPDF